MKYGYQMKGELVGSCIHSLTAFFKTCQKMNEEKHFLLASNLLEGVAQAWWQSQSTSLDAYMELNGGTSSSPQPRHITPWEDFYKPLTPWDGVYKLVCMADKHKERG
jgi:hypothetical protein